MSSQNEKLNQELNPISDENFTIPKEKKHLEGVCNGPGR